MSASVTVHTLRDSEYDEWDRFVAASPDGSIYSTAVYLDTLCAAAGGRFRIIAATRGDRALGGIPLYERSSRSGVFVEPRLLLFYLGPVLARSESKYPSQQTAQAVGTLGALAEATLALGYAKVTLKSRHTLSDVRPFVARGWKAWPSYSYIVPLHDMRAQWNRVDQNLRRLVDRCASQNISHVEDDDFESFLRLHRLTMAHHDAAVYLPDDRFRAWFKTLHRLGLCRLFHARLPGGESIAAQIVLLGDHPVSHTVSAASDPAHRNLGAAAFLRWRTFEWLAAHGKTGNDLTDATLNSVTQFKSQLGGDLVASFVVETRGSPMWRGAERLQNAYKRMRRGARLVIRAANPRQQQ